MMMMMVVVVVVVVRVSDSFQIFSRGGGNLMQSDPEATSNCAKRCRLNLPSVRELLFT